MDGGLTVATPRINVRAIVHEALSQPRTFLARVAYAVQADWRARAASGVRASPGTTAAYQNAINVELGQGTGASVAVTLSGLLPNIMEQGTGPTGVGSQGTFDLRTFLLRPSTKHIRFGKKGMYLAVPFGMTIEAIAAAGGKAAVAAAQALAPTLSERVRGEERAVSWGERLGPNVGGAARQGRYINAPGQARGHLTVHAADPLQGLVRTQASYSQASAGQPQSGFKKWRVVSEAGRPWYSRGVEARRLADRVQQGLDAILQGMR